MKLFKKAKELQFFLSNNKFTGITKGFVPTMGALHAGHISLIEMSKASCGLTVCSIFVNPTQFNNKNDFEKYPVTIGNDILLLEQSGCDVLFLPQIEEIYPSGTNSLPSYELGNLELVLEGKYRPGHFQGVCQVVHNLLNIVQPDVLFLGQKDFQQCMVIQKLIEITGSKVRLIIGDTMRETSGLAMSSRNQRLSQLEKAQAVAIYEMLEYIKHNISTVSPEKLCSYATEYLLNHGFNKVDYVAIAEPTTLTPFYEKPASTAVALVAAYIGEIRLIDNMIINH